MTTIKDLLDELEKYDDAMEVLLNASPMPSVEGSQ